LPPLRERPEDIPLLVRHLLDQAEQGPGAGGRYQISARMLEKLQRHSWPGNVRELRNFLERTVSLAEGTALDGTLSGAGGVDPRPGQGDPASPPTMTDVARTLPEAAAGAEAIAMATLLALPFKTAKRLHGEPFERQYLEALLHRAGQNVSKAAREAEMDRAYLIQLLKKHDLK